jgi:hypothetical protein
METGQNPFTREKRGSRIVVSKKELRTEDGIVFASRWERRVYVFLRDNFGKESFKLQPSFLLVPAFVDADGIKRRPIVYKADFIFGPIRSTPDAPLTGEHCVIDAKGMQDAVFKMKHKMYLYAYKHSIWLPSRVRDLEQLADHLETLGHTRTKPTKKRKNK